MIKRIAGIVVLFLLIGYLAFSIVGLTDSPMDDEICSDISVRVQDSLGYELIDKDMVLELLTRKGVNPIDKTMSGINLDSMERVLESHPLVVSAQCFKTPGGMVRVKIHSPALMLRVMSRSGADYMVDSRGKIVDYRADGINLPIASGYISRSLASGRLAELARYIQSDDFWRDQIEQIYVDEKGQIELVPRVGNHILALGDGSDAPEKLDRIFRFYKEGLNNIGWNKYHYISAAFDGQIVCK